MTAFLEPDHATSDLDLIARARGTDPEAVEELYRRHRDAALRFARSLTDPVTAEDVVAEAFARVLESLRAGGGPTLAFRPYLLTAVRNVYVTHVRGDSRFVWTEDELEGEPLPRDEAADRHESSLLASAFETLPERWQAVLWHTAVEDDDHDTVGRLLGIKPNAVAALGFRARDGLRKAYLSAHLAAVQDEACRPFREQLAPYVRGRLRGNRRTQVESHVASCAHCTAGVLELGALNTQLGATLAPALLGASATGYAATVVAATAAGGWLGAVAFVARQVRRLRNPAVAAGTAAATAVAAVAATALVVVDTGDRPREEPAVVDVVKPDRAGDPGDPAPPAPPGPAPDRPDPTRPDPEPEIEPAIEPVAATPTPTPTRPPRPTPTASPAPSATPTPTPSATPTPTPTPSASPTPTPTPTPTVDPSPSPTGPTYSTFEDLSLADGSVETVSGRSRVSMVATALLPAVLTLEVRGYTGHTLRLYRPFQDTTCSTSVAGETTTLTCGLARGIGVFTVDLDVTGPLAVTARITASGNGDPQPANDVLTFGG